MYVCVCVCGGVVAGPLRQSEGGEGVARWPRTLLPAGLATTTPLAQSPSGHSGVRSRCTAQLPLSPPLAPDPGGGTQRRLQSC